MRRIGLALGLIVCTLAQSVTAFDIEEEKVFPANGAETRELALLSTTDIDVFAPLIAAFQADNPGVAVRYTAASTTALFAAIGDEGAAYDLALSSAMDLQMKLANDGFGLPHLSQATGALPGWAKWRDQLFAVAQEPVVLLVSDAAFAGIDLPQTRGDLIGDLRENPDLFRGRIGTYDPRLSGAGYLFATQDAR